MKNIGLPTRLILALGGVILIWGSPGEIGSQSKGADSWLLETSYASLQLRAIGALKLGMGLGFLGAALTGVSAAQTQGAAHQLAQEAVKRTEPKPQSEKPNPKKSSNLPSPPMTY